MRVNEERCLECLDADFARLREVVAGALDATVPSCPEWTGADLATHVAEVYLHKAETMRLGAWPTPWPPAFDDPLAALDENYRRLTGEFAARDVGDHALTWYGPDQTVGFWLRRMAQETVIHRLDAELAAEAPHAPVPTDLADDGIDEVLVRFLAFGASEYPEELAEHLPDCDGRTVRIHTGTAGWQVRLGPTEIAVERGEGDAEAGVHGDAPAVLRWLWRRAGDEAVRLDGNRWVLGKLRAMMGIATQ